MSKFTQTIANVLYDEIIDQLAKTQLNTKEYLTLVKEGQAYRDIYNESSNLLKCEKCNVHISEDENIHCEGYCYTCTRNDYL